MIKSMTGYGRGEAILNGRDITVEIKSVNSRYFEYSSRIPRSCAFLDDKLKKLLSETNKGAPPKAAKAGVDYAAEAEKELSSRRWQKATPTRWPSWPISWA